jgi:hypothetical protein
MKKVIFLSLIFTIIISGCTKQKSSPIEGAWQMVYFRSIRGDTVRIQFPGARVEVSDIKIWSKNHVAFVGRFKRDTVFLDNYGGGTYKLDGNKYEESLTYHSSKKLVGTKIKMLLENRNDTLIQTFPVDDNGNIVNKSTYIVEKFVRLD